MNTEQLRAELLPCPFCGGNAKEYERFNSNTVTCLGCGVKVRQSEMGKGDASERWNRRAALQSQDKETAGIVEVMREAAQIIAAISPEHAPKNIRWPIVDELEGFASMIDHARRIEGEGE